MDKKAGNYKHGYKAHVGVDANSGLIMSNKTTPANIHDVNVCNDLLHVTEIPVALVRKIIEMLYQKISIIL